MKAHVVMRCKAGHETKLTIERQRIDREYMRLTVDLLMHQSKLEGGCQHAVGDGMCRAAVNVQGEIL